MLLFVAIVVDKEVVYFSLDQRSSSGTNVFIRQIIILYIKFNVNIEMSDLISDKAHVWK